MADTVFTGRIEEIKLEALSGSGLVIHGDRVGLDGDSPFTFKIHGVKELILLLPFRDRLGSFKQSIGKSGLPMIDVGDDGKIPGQFDGHAIRKRKVEGTVAFPGRGRSG